MWASSLSPPQKNLHNLGEGLNIQQVMMEEHRRQLKRAEGQQFPEEAASDPNSTCWLFAAARRNGSSTDSNNVPISDSTPTPRLVEVKSVMRSESSLWQTQQSLNVCRVAISDYDTKIYAGAVLLLSEAKPTTMTAPAPLRAASSLSPLAQRARSHPPRTIQYILLDSCRNVPASHILAGTDSHKAHRRPASCHPVNHIPSTAVGCCPLLPSYLPLFLTFPILPSKPAQGSGHCLDARKRLPVFLKLCEEDVATTSPRDARLQISSHEQKVQPSAKAPREGKRGKRMKKTAGYTPSDKA
ncbi:hypothetical protein CIB84_002080 [Bambusicola thoracicus]|uniref:Uncharacterized protein n=1 Tax=Bambusicola thoracicus TaxID=9083 RepID=A0A2P4TCW7_BAMTH|nr:hypothetical protein CIB84_002080 [Bambusicola thoracicus]